MKQEPHHFSMQDFIKALLGSIIVTITFLFKGSMQSYAVQMKNFNVIIVIILTLLIVSIEIYLLSYRFVVDRKKRSFHEFWAKRFFSIIVSSFIAVYLIIYAYGVSLTLSNVEIFKLASAIFLPAAIAGAAVEILKKR